MEKGTLILLCGLPGSGKTTLAQKLEKERTALRLCPDEWILALLKDKTDMQEFDRLRGPVEQLLWHETQRLLLLGVTVILENGFWPRVEKRNARVETSIAIAYQNLIDWQKLFDAPINKEGELYNFYCNLESS